MPVESDTAHIAVAATVAVKLPDFWKSDPQMWFAQAEAQFALAKIVNDETKFYHIVAKVDSSVIYHIADLVTKPPEENKYNAVKERLISRFALSPQQRLEKLLGAHELGDLRPTHLLSKMRELATGLGVDDNLLKMLFLQRLPDKVRPILGCHDGTINKLADMADQIVDTLNTSSTAAVNVGDIPGEIDLREQIEVLAAEVRRLRTRDRSASRSRYEPVSELQKNVCWYHAKFGRNANRCRKPCSFQTKN